MEQLIPQVLLTASANTLMRNAVSLNCCSAGGLSQRWPRIRALEGIFTRASVAVTSLCSQHADVIANVAGLKCLTLSKCILQTILVYIRWACFLFLHCSAAMPKTDALVNSAAKLAALRTVLRLVSQERSQKIVRILRNKGRAAVFTEPHRLQRFHRSSGGAPCSADHSNNWYSRLDSLLKLWPRRDTM